eukprot:5251378-Prymnesium_polylepis.1
MAARARGVWAAPLNTGRVSAYGQRYTGRSISKSITNTLLGAPNTANTANTEVPRLDRFLY